MPVAELDTAEVRRRRDGRAETRFTTPDPAASAPAAVALARAATLCAVTSPLKKVTQDVADHLSAGGAGRA